MGFFSFNSQEFAKALLPPWLRSTSMIAFVKSLLRPLKDLADRDSEYFDQELLRANYNGQKLVMQTVLNTELGLAANTVIVVTVDDSGAGLFAGNDDEIPVTYAGNENESGFAFAGNDSEVSTPLGYDFKVQVPSAQNTTNNINLIKHIIDRIKVPKKYIIEIV